MRFFYLFSKIVLLVLSQINTIASLLVKVKISDFQTRFTMSSGFFALLTPARHVVSLVHRVEADSFSS